MTNSNFFKKTFFWENERHIESLFVFPHLVHLNSAQAEEHRTEARPNDIFRSAVSLNHPYTIPLFYDIQPFGTPTPPAIAAGYSNALKGGKVQSMNR